MQIWSSKSLVLCRATGSVFGRFLTGGERNGGYATFVWQALAHTRATQMTHMASLKPLSLLCQNEGSLRHQRVMCVSQRKNVPPIKVPPFKSARCLNDSKYFCFWNLFSALHYIMLTAKSFGCNSFALHYMILTATCRLRLFLLHYIALPIPEGSQFCDALYIWRLHLNMFSECNNVIVSQDMFDHDKWQKSAISGRRPHWIFFSVFSSGFFSLFSRFTV